MSDENDLKKKQEFVSRCYDLNNLTFLVGTGLSKEFDGPTMKDIASELISSFNNSSITDGVINQWIDKDLKNDCPNVERLLDRLYVKKKYLNDIEKEDENTEKAIDTIRKKIFDMCLFIPNKDKLHFLFIFLNSLVNRKAGLSRVNLFTLNYDLLVDKCADELGILVSDGFDGSVKRWLNTAQFDLDYYYPSGIVGEKPIRCERVLNYFKLHGSLNWVSEDNRIIKGLQSFENMIIYPCINKYNVVLFEPLAEIFRRFSVSVKRLKSALFIIGYSFNDAHINQIILQALEQPSFRIIAINPDLSCIESSFPESQRYAEKIIKIEAGFKNFVEDYILPTREESLNPIEEIVNVFKKLIDKNVK